MLEKHYQKFLRKNGVTVEKSLQWNLEIGREESDCKNREKKFLQKVRR